MNYLDIIILIVVAVGFLLGFKDGLIRKIIGLIGLFVGIYIAYRFSDFFGSILLPIFNDDKNLADIFAGIILFLLIVLLFSVLKRIIHPLDKVNKLLNQLLGGLAGTLQVVFFISAVFVLLKVFNVPNKKDKDSSFMYQKVYFVVPSTISFLFGESSGAQTFIQKFIQNNDNTNSKKK